MSRIANYHATNRNIYTDNLSFLSHCFKSCIKNLNESMLDGYEQDCSSNFTANIKNFVLKSISRLASFWAI